MINFIMVLFSQLLKEEIDGLITKHLIMFRRAMIEREEIEEKPSPPVTDYSPLRGWAYASIKSCSISCLLC